VDVSNPHYEEMKLLPMLQIVTNPRVTCSLLLTYTIIHLVPDLDISPIFISLSPIRLETLFLPDQTPIRS
jgi:hypothetical protein